MKAIIQNKYGGTETMKLVEIPVPNYKQNQLLIKIHATNVSSGDMKINTLSVPLVLKFIMKMIFGFKGPRNKIRGIAASGEVIEVGKEVKKYKKGDLIYFINSMKDGCLAEYIVLHEKGVIARKPENISHVEAAPIAFGAMSAYHFINSKTISKNNDVLIYGASGSVGSYALQLAKFYGANVTAVSSKKNHQALLKLGADHVIDYHEVDFRTLAVKYDMIFDAVYKINRKSCKNVLKPNGKYYSIMQPTKESISRLNELNQIINAGKMTSLIDKVYEFDHYKEAHEHTYTGHKVGNVVIRII